MKELDELEDAFLIFASSLSNFETHLIEGEFKQQDVKLLAFQTVNKLQRLYNEIDGDIKRLYKIKNL